MQTGPTWTVREDDNLKACVAGGMLTSTIAERLDRTRPEIEERILALGLKKPRVDCAKRKRRAA